MVSDLRPRLPAKPIFTRETRDAQKTRVRTTSDLPNTIPKDSPEAPAPYLLLISRRRSGNLERIIPLEELAQQSYPGSSTATQLARDIVIRHVRSEGDSGVPVTSARRNPVTNSGTRLATGHASRIGEDPGNRQVRWLSKARNWRAGQVRSRRLRCRL
jgi:hypothetical protein